MNILSAFSNNKLYLENNLLPLQIYYSGRKQIMKHLTKEKQCVMQKIWNEYETLLSMDEFVNVRISANEYKMFRYEPFDKDHIKIILNAGQVGIMDISDFVRKETMQVKKSDVFFGSYKPLSILMCRDLPIINVGRTIGYRNDKIEQLISIWLQIERLKITLTTLLESIEVERILKF